MGPTCRAEEVTGTLLEKIREEHWQCIPYSIASQSLPLRALNMPKAVATPRIVFSTSPSSTAAILMATVLTSIDQVRPTTPTTSYRGIQLSRST